MKYSRSDRDCFVPVCEMEFESREACEVNVGKGKENYNSNEYFLRYLVS